MENEALLSAFIKNDRDQVRRSAEAAAKMRLEEYRLGAVNDSLLRFTASRYNSSMTSQTHGWNVVRPRFEITIGKPEHVLRYKKNTDSFLKKIEEAVDAGCMRDWMHKQTIFILFIDIPRLDMFYEKRYELYIWYQTQQSSTQVGFSRKFAYVMDNVDQVWHYSQMNIQGLGEMYNHSLATAEKDGRYYYVPMWTSLHESFLHSQVSEIWKIDALLFGNLNTRRKSICSQLEKMKLRVWCKEDWAFFEQWTNKSRLLLNVHKTNKPVALEVDLINPALAKGMIVVSEEGADKELDKIYAPVVTFAPLNELVQMVKNTLSQPEAELAAKRKFNREWMRERSRGVDPNLCFALSRLVKTANKKLLNVSTY